MRDKKIAILALQETHLTEEYIKSLHELYGRRIKIYHTGNPDQPNAHRVAVVLNRELLANTTPKIREVVPGQASMLKLEWHQQSKLNVLAMYAPNSPTESQRFWADLRNYWKNNGLIKPDVMMGDFNVVEDSINRLPGHPDNVTTVEALPKLKLLLRTQRWVENTEPKHAELHLSSDQYRQ